MKKIVFVLSIMIAFTVGMNSCEHVPDTVSPVDPQAPPPGTPGGPVSGGGQPCDPDTMYFQNRVLPLIISSCAKSNCHDAASQQDGVDLSSYDRIMATGDIEPGNPNDSEIYEVLNETDPDKVMPRPPNAPFTAAEKEVIRKWIAQGARNNSCEDCDTTVYSWSAAVVPLINTNCRGCHNPNYLSAGLDLTDYPSVRSVALDGRLMGSLNHVPGFPAMPLGAPKLDECKLTIVQKWIDDGAPNN